jgi:hypothetical protein
MKLSIPIAGAVLVLAPLGAHARVPIEDNADHWYDSCNNNLTVSSPEYCLGYTRSVADTLKALNSNVACIPDGVGETEMIDVGREYVDEYARGLKDPHGLEKLSAAALIIKSFAKKWPCAEERHASRVQLAQNQSRFYDSRGNSVGTATRDSQGTTTFRDSRGNITGKEYRR